MLLVEILILIEEGSGKLLGEHMRNGHTGNLSPYIEKDPVPSPFMKSPPY